MGNQLVKEYDVRGQVATGGPGGVWKVYDAVKKTTARNVSVWILERKNLEQLGKGGKGSGISKRAQDVIYEALKREAQQLTRLRHPSLLEVVEPLDDSRNVLAFATEPVFASLANLLGSHANLSPVPAELQNYQLSDLEIQKGLLQIAKGLQFLHDDVKLIHGNFSPETVFVNGKGDWKISGFSFCCPTRYEGASQKAFVYAPYDSTLPSIAQPYLEYLAPEYIFESRCDVSSDIFSFGCLAYALYNGGKSPLAVRDSVSSFKEAIARVDQTNLAQVPAAFKATLQQMLSTHAEVRPVAKQIPTSPYFDDLLLRAILFLDVMVQKSPPEKAEFFRSLPKVMPQFPDRILFRKILPTLLEELKDLQLAPFLLLSILFICEKLSVEEYATKVLPFLRPLFTVADPPQISIILIQRIDLLLKKTPKTDIKDHVMPLLYYALETPNAQVQQKALKALPQVMETLDYATIKASVYPRLENLLTHSEVSAVRVTALMCIHAILRVFDKATLVERVIPALKVARKPDAAVMMATLGVLDEVGKKYVDKETIAFEIMPMLWRMMLEPILNVQQFRTFSNVIRDLTKQVEEQQLQQLEQQAALESQAKALSQSAAAMVDNDMTSFNKIISNATPTLLGTSSATTVSPASLTSSNSIMGWLDDPLPVTAPAAPSVADSSIFASLQVAPQQPTKPSAPQQQQAKPAAQQQPQQQQLNFSQPLQPTPTVVQSMQPILQPATPQQQQQQQANTLFASTATTPAWTSTAATPATQNWPSSSTGWSNAPAAAPPQQPASTTGWSNSTPLQPQPQTNAGWSSSTSTAGWSSSGQTSQPMQPISQPMQPQQTAGWPSATPANASVWPSATPAQQQQQQRPIAATTGGWPSATPAQQQQQQPSAMNFNNFASALPQQQQQGQLAKPNAPKVNLSDFESLI